MSLCIKLDTHCAQILRRDSDRRSHRENLLGDFGILVLYFQNKYECVCILSLLSDVASYLVGIVPSEELSFSLLLIHRKKLDCALLLFSFCPEMLN